MIGVPRDLGMTYHKQSDTDGYALVYIFYFTGAATYLPKWNEARSNVENRGAHYYYSCHMTVTLHSSNVTK